MKLKLVTALTAILLTSPVYAGNQKPNACPNPSAIARAGFNAILHLDKTTSKAWQKNNDYGTNVAWSFFYGPYKNVDGNEMLKLAQTAINSLELISGPIENKKDRFWSCTYRSTKAGENQREGIAYYLT